MNSHDEKSKMKNAFPSYLEEEIETIFNKIILKPSKNNDTFAVMMDGEKITIPKRIYEDEIDYTDFTIVQQTILNCYYTRHYNGFIREKYLKKIISCRYKWVIPYVVQLIGEYVIEILDIIYDERDNVEVKSYQHFFAENEIFYRTTKDRAISYWNCYYKSKYPCKKEYVGLKILKFICPEKYIGKI